MKMDEEENLVDHWKLLDRRVETGKKEYREISIVGIVAVAAETTFVTMVEMFDH